MNIFSIDIQEPYLTFIINGEKTIEGRLNKGKFAQIKAGDILKVGPDGIQFRVLNKNIYSTFREMIEKEGLANIVPDKDNIDDATNIYYNFYTKDQEKEFGIVAIRVSRI